MNIKIHKAENRGFFDHGWLKTYHSFSFGGYYNPDRMGFGSLRVLNDDQIAAESGFGMHPHDNMEIVTVPISGTLTHTDSQGNKEIISKGEIQLMSAGRGIMHSEFNESVDTACTLLQIWVIPNVADTEPGYSQKFFDTEERLNRFQIVVSPDADSEALFIKQNAWFSLIDLNKSLTATYEPKRKDSELFIFAIRGSVAIKDEIIDARDSAEISDIETTELTALSDCELLLIEMSR